MKKFLKSFSYSWKGIAAGFTEEPNIKIELAIALVIIAAGFFFGITTTEWIAILFCIGLVISLELINTAIENLVNLVTRETNPLAGKIKDIASGAVLVASLTAAIIGAIIFYKYIFRYLIL